MAEIDLAAIAEKRRKLRYYEHRRQDLYGRL